MFFIIIIMITGGRAGGWAGGRAGGWAPFKKPQKLRNAIVKSDWKKQIMVLAFAVGKSGGDSLLVRVTLELSGGVERSALSS